jgi:hypothetical protein
MATQAQWLAHLMVAEPHDIPFESAILAGVFTEEEKSQLLNILAGALSRLSLEQQTQLWNNITL